ncbi:hypothetical protein BC829DRAFT_390944 [Chytridium lagenaria]|nr:hypothetical protein BC829DRAFT_390944 [Chytridium lagenaria]
MMATTLEMLPSEVCEGIAIINKPLTIVSSHPVYLAAALLVCPSIVEDCLKDIMWMRMWVDHRSESLPTVVEIRLCVATNLIHRLNLGLDDLERVVEREYVDLVDDAIERDHLEAVRLLVECQLLKSEDQDLLSRWVVRAAELDRYDIFVLASPSIVRYTNDVRILDKIIAHPLFEFNHQFIYAACRQKNFGMLVELDKRQPVDPAEVGFAMHYHSMAGGDVIQDQVPSSWYAAYVKCILEKHQSTPRLSSFKSFVTLLKSSPALTPDEQQHVNFILLSSDPRVDATLDYEDILCTVFLQCKLGIVNSLFERMHVDVMVLADGELLKDVAEREFVFLMRVLSHPRLDTITFDAFAMKAVGKPATSNEEIVSGTIADRFFEPSASITFLKQLNPHQRQDLYLEITTQKYIATRIFTLSLQTQSSTVINEITALHDFPEWQRDTHIVLACKHHAEWSVIQVLLRYPHDTLTLMQALEVLMDKCHPDTGRIGVELVQCLTSRDLRRFKKRPTEQWLASYGKILRAGLEGRREEVVDRMLSLRNKELFVDATHLVLAVEGGFKQGVVEKIAKYVS